MRHMAAAAFLVASLVAPIGADAQAIAEQKIQGTVLRTRVTLCELKPRGCAGYMILEAERPGGRERTLVQVRLGVPIRQEERYVALALLAGHKVSVVYVKEKGGIVARSIEVLGKAAPAAEGLTLE